jgi:signal peptidase
MTSTSTPATPTRRSALARLVGQTLAVLLLLAVLAIAALAIVIPRLTGSVPLTVLTSSMEPGMPPGTLAVVRPVDPDDIGVGDIVTYQIRVDVPGVISHRVVGITVGADGRRLFTFKGDNNTAVDPDRVVPAQIMGRVWYSIPGLGFVNTTVAGNAKTWIVPTLGIALIGYALVLVVRALVGARSGRRRATDAVGARDMPDTDYTHGTPDTDDATDTTDGRHGTSRHCASRPTPVASTAPASRRSPRHAAAARR